MRRIWILFFVYFSVVASTTRVWKREDASHFLKGTLEGVSLSWDGVLRPSFKLTRLADVKEDFVLSFLQDGSRFWVGTGHEGRFYRIDPDGKVHLVYDAPELDIYTVARDSRGYIYFATSPRGKIYQVKGDKVEEFFDPEGRFIWKLKFHNGFLYAATGKPSTLYKIDLQGAGQKIAELPDSQILDFVFEGGNIYLATSGRGRVYLYDGKGTTLLWESPYEEVSSITFWKGKIYAATQGRVSGREKIILPQRSNTSAVEITVTPKSSGKKPRSRIFRQGGSYVYQIDPATRKALVFWENPHKYVSSLAVYRGDLYAATGGDRARVFKMVDFYKGDLVEEVEAREVRLLHPADRLYIITSTPTGIYRMESVKEGGYYLSDVLDGGGQSRWGRIYFRGQGVEVYTRSGNSATPDSTWEGWTPGISSGEKILSSPARYLQVKVKIPPNGFLTSLKVFYKKMNLPPRIESIKLYPPNVVFKEYSREKIRGLSDERGDRPSTSGLAVKRAYRRGYRTVMWKASDPDGDGLVYTVIVKGEKTKITMEKEWKDNYYALDTTFLPDGEYRVEVVASDLPSNPSQEAQEVSRTSESFLVDNTPPEISVTSSSKGLVVVVRDRGSGVKGVYYTTDGKHWVLARPQDGLYDGLEEKFNFNKNDIMALRAVDRHGNARTLPLGGK